MIAVLAIAGALMLDVPAKPEPTPSPTPAPAAVAASKPVRYCYEGTPTGTRIARRDCRTRAEWLDRGFDPLAKE